MTYDPSIFNTNPYYDDFDDAKGFLRILFKPGYPVQARELTQAQSILQNQVSRLGNHLFKDGSRVLGGGIGVRNSNFLMVDAGVNSPLAGSTDYDRLVGGYLTSNVSEDATEAKVVGYIPPDVGSDGYLILIVDFVSGFQFTSTFKFTKDSLIINGFTVATSPIFSTSGRCKLVTVTDGIFYIDGFFVQTKNQVFAPYNVTTTHRDLMMDDYANLNKKVGFVIQRDNVTDKEDASLRDPSIGSSNYNAPGADRYTIVPVLGQYSIEETPEDFVELVRFEGGKISRKVDRISYGEIENTLARRTYDESGSYSVNPFDITVKENQSDPEDTNYYVSIGQGKAYVFGKEIENQFPVSVPIPRARTKKTEGVVGSLATNSYDFTVGNYINVVVSGFTLPFGSNLHTIGSGSAIVNFHNASNALVATGYIHGAIPNTAAGANDYKYRLYLYGISGNINSGTSAMAYLNVGPGGPGFLANGVTVGRFTPETGSVFTLPSLTNKQSLVFDVTPGYAIADFKSAKIFGKMIGGSSNLVSASHNTSTNVTTYTVTKDHFAGSLTSSVSSAVNFINYSSGVPTSSSDTAEIAIVASDGKAFVPPATGVVLSTVNDNQFELKITNPPAGFTTGSFRIVAPIVYTPDPTDSSTYRTKTLNTGKTHTFVSTAFSVDSSGRKFFELPDIDIYSVESIVNNATPGTSYLNDFELDDGQREAVYTKGRLYLKQSATGLARYGTISANAVTVKVTYSNFTHQGLEYAPFIGKHSYTDILYENIPLYTNPRSGRTVSLANCIDFRRSGLTASTPMLKPYGRSEFGSNGDTQLQYEHYLPRIDKLCLNVNPQDGSANFFLQSGQPSLSPLPPADPEDALVLASLTVPSYTHNPEDVVITPVDTKRYTMSDIGKMEKRIDDVEVFTKLSLSENEIETRSLKLVDSDPEPLKTSIFVDEFYGHSVADVSSNEHICSIDFERGEMRPFFSTVDMVVPNPVVSGTVVSADKIVTLAYSKKAYIENKQYTKTVKINPTNNISWLGFMNVSTSIIPTYDRSVRPIVKTNGLMENDNWISCNAGDARGFGTQWNDWDSIWYGIDYVDEEQDDVQKRVFETPRVSSESSIPNINSGNVRSFSSRSAKPLSERTSNFIRAAHLRSRIKNRIGTKVVDRSVVPYIPFTTINVSVRGLKPNSTGLFGTIDGELVASGISTDSSGSSNFTMNFSSGTHLIGSRTVRVSDTPNIVDAQMSADAVVNCTGLVNQRSSGVYSVRPVELRRQSPSSETISKDPFNRDIDTVQNDQWADPMAQTFFVDSKSNPEGVFLKSASLYFSRKDAKLPVVVQIRPTVSGYPSPSVVVPFSTTVLLPDSVNANNETPQETVFEFSSPVYLEPGEYALCVMANSDDYELYAADTAFNAIATGESSAGRAGNMQLVGTLYTPQGIGASVSNPTTDLMFTMHRCEFVGQGDIRWAGVSGISGVQIVRVGATELVPTGCSIQRTIADYSYSQGQSIYLENLSSANTTDMKSVLSRGISNAVSPVIDLQSLAVTGIKMRTLPSVSTSDYVSRVVELPDNISSNALAVFIDENTPANTRIDVYYRYITSGETEIFEKPWIAVPRQSTVTPAFSANSEFDFREAQYRTTALPTGVRFQSYQIRVQMRYPSTPTYENTPAIRNIKTVSFIR